MKYNLKLKTSVFYAAIMLTSILTALYSYKYFRSVFLIILLAVYGIFILLLFTGYMFMLRRHVTHSLSQLSDIISSLSELSKEEIVSSLNDEMISKIQSQVTKLANILKSQNESLRREGDDLKSLVSDISHQLKTPLANLKIYFDLLSDNDLSDNERSEFLENIQKQLSKFSFLIESMIQLSRLETGIIQLHPDLRSINDLCLTAIKQILPKAEAKEIIISYDGLDINLTYDFNWTCEALFNILDNAVKYTPSGGTIAVTVKDYEMYSEIQVKDTGAGIEEKEVPNIFKRFYRGRNSAGIEGAGLGLYLSRKIIQSQDGYIKVVSAIKKGSIFSVFLYKELISEKL